MSKLKNTPGGADRWDDRGRDKKCDGGPLDKLWRRAPRRAPRVHQH